MSFITAYIGSFITDSKASIIGDDKGFFTEVHKGSPIGTYQGAFVCFLKLPLTSFYKNHIRGTNNSLSNGSEIWEKIIWKNQKKCVLFKFWAQIILF